MSDTGNALVTIPSSNIEIYRMSTDAAGLCGAIVKQTAQKIQGKQYVRVEGWQAIAVAHGCVASSRDVETVEGGIRAIGEIRRMTDGFVIAEAEGFVGDDEQTWAKRPMFARRAMAQTRAISRACRSAFAHVVVMIDASLSTTPAEEMQAVYENEPAGESPFVQAPEVTAGLKKWVEDQKTFFSTLSTTEDAKLWNKTNLKQLNKLLKEDESLWQDLKKSYDALLSRVHRDLAA